MNKMKQAGTLAALVGALCATGTARADGIFAAPQYYLGVHAGVANGDGTKHDDTSIYPISDDASRANIGILAGINFRNGPWLYGVEADYGFMNSQIESCDSNFVFLCETKANYHLRARLGYQVGKVDLFVAGGFAGAKGRMYNLADYYNKRLTGYSIGAGADLAVTEQGVLRVEVLKDKYDDKEFGPTDYGVNDWEDLTVRAAAIFTF